MGLDRIGDFGPWASAGVYGTGFVAESLGKVMD